MEHYRAARGPGRRRHLARVRPPAACGASPLWPASALAPQREFAFLPLLPPPRVDAPAACGGRAASLRIARRQSASLPLSACPDSRSVRWAWAALGAPACPVQITVREPTHREVSCPNAPEVHWRRLVDDGSWLRATQRQALGRDGRCARRQAPLGVAARRARSESHRHRHFCLHTARAQADIRKLALHV